MVVASNDQQLLARRTIPMWRIVMDAAITYVHAVENGEMFGVLLWMTLPHMATM